MLRLLVERGTDVEAHAVRVLAMSLRTLHLPRYMVLPRLPAHGAGIALQVISTRDADLAGPAGPDGPAWRRPSSAKPSPVFAATFGETGRRRVPRRRLRVWICSPLQQRADDIGRHGVKICREHQRRLPPLIGRISVGCQSSIGVARADPVGVEVTCRAMPAPSARSLGGGQFLIGSAGTAHRLFGGGGPMISWNSGSSRNDARSLSPDR